MRPMIAQARRRAFEKDSLGFERSSRRQPSYPPSECEKEQIGTTSLGLRYLVSGEMCKD
jgi:hypothetical protein